MSKRKAELRRQREQRAKTIQWAGIGVAVFVIAVLGWVLWPKPVTTSFDCQIVNNGVFDDAKRYTECPPQVIETDKQYFATVRMAKGGEFVIQLYPDKAPITVNSFVFLAREGYFNGVTFHRVLEGFMAQGGDPTGTGMGGPGYQFQNEDSDLTFDKAGVVAMANAGRDTNGSQFFITFAPAPHLNGGYTIFGQVIQGMEVVNGLTRRDPSQNPNFTGDVIESITISEK
ncbi:MAG: peptidylprolyl isomerase [Anaerolineae bacterium]|nr:MAG: peptidylprolyl isomerase [Anaerolineae bacterium]